MSKNLSQLETLPNEILIEIFEHLDARDLFRAFYNLNLRINKLLQCLNKLCLMLSIHDREEISANAIFLPYIQILIVKYNKKLYHCILNN